MQPAARENLAKNLDDCENEKKKKNHKNHPEYPERFYICF